MAAPMHDIGKIGIPDAILQKPGRLTREEFEVMKTHTIVGAKMLEHSESAILQMAHQIAWNHHERWDGTGYPRGLCGTAIPEEARILSLVNVYDALTHCRVYREAMPEPEASGVDGARAREPVRSDSFWRLSGAAAPRCGGSPTTTRRRTLEGGFPCASACPWQSATSTPGRDMLPYPMRREPAGIQDCPRISSGISEWRARWTSILQIVAIPLFFACFEATKEWLAHGLTKWESHFLSIGVVAIISVIVVSRCPWAPGPSPAWRRPACRGGPAREFAALSALRRKRG